MCIRDRRTFRHLQRLRAAAPGRRQADSAQAARVAGKPGAHWPRHPADGAAAVDWRQLGLSAQGTFLGAPGELEGQDLSLIHI